MTKEQFAHRLYELRVKKGYTAVALSLTVGKSSGYISLLENGTAFPKFGVFFELCELLGVSESEFFDLNNQVPELTREFLEEFRHLDYKQAQRILEIMRDINRKS